MKVLASLALSAFLATPMLAQDIATRPFVLTQGHNGSTQHVLASHPVQVQLPSNPDGQGQDQVVWSFDADQSREVLMTQLLHIPSPGRIAGFDTVTVIGFEVAKGSEAVIVITSDTGNLISEDGRYVVKLIAK